VTAGRVVTGTAWVPPNVAELLAEELFTKVPVEVVDFLRADVPPLIGPVPVRVVPSAMV